jgi:hypothetical protein
MVEKVQAKQWSKRYRQSNGRKGTGKAMVEKVQAMQWSKRYRQCNGRKGTGNAMVEKVQAMQWSKRTNTDIKTATHKIKDRPPQTPLKFEGVLACSKHIDRSTSDTRRVTFGVK